MVMGQKVPIGKGPLRTRPWWENCWAIQSITGSILARLGSMFWTAAKTLQTAAKKYAGDAAPIQHCQVHKRRNVLDHLLEEQQGGVARKLNAAYALEDYNAARQALEGLRTS